MSKAEKEVIVPSDPVSREKIKKALQSIGDEWAIIEGHKAVIKETIDAVAEEHELPKKFVRKLAKTMYMQNFKNQEKEFEDFQELYEKVVENPTGFVSEGGDNTVGTHSFHEDEDDDYGN